MVAAAGPSASGTPWRHVTLSQLIDVGLVVLPLLIEHQYKGRQLSARVEAADRVRFEGQVCDSLSTAGGIARRSVVGARSGREYPQTNGWTFWQFRRPDGNLAPLDELRKALYERKVVPMAEARGRGA